MNKAEECFEEQLEMNVIHVHEEEELQRMFKFAEAYHESRVKAISDDEIKKISKEYSDSIGVRIDFVNIIKFGLKQLLKQ